MDYIINTLLHFLMLYKYSALFLISYSTSVILPLPTNTVVFVAGVLSRQGYFNIASTFFVALSANVLGDCTGFVIARIWGDKVNKSAIAQSPYFIKIERFMSDHVRATILITRFMGTAGSIVNLLAGLIKLPASTFIAYDIIGNIVDAGIFMAAGYMLQSYVESSSDIISGIGFGLFALGLVVVAVILFRNNKK